MQNLKINRNIIIVFFIGLSLGLIIMNLLTPKKSTQLSDLNNTILTIDNTSLTADQYYEYLKTNNGITVLLDIIDNKILKEMYQENEEMLTNVNKQCYEDINYYISYYGKSENDFYKSMNVKNRNEYLEKLKLEYRRKKYYNEYLRSLITDNDIQKYYDNFVYGDIKTKYISIKTDNVNANTILNEILDKLNNGYTYDQIIEEYNGIIEYNDLGYLSYNQDNYESYINTLLSLNENSYSKNYVETYYGYTIIFREDQKEKISLSDAKADIINLITKKIDKEDTKLYYRTLIELRKSKNIKFQDENIETLYNNYCSSYY